LELLVETLLQRGDGILADNAGECIDFAHDGVTPGPAILSKRISSPLRFVRARPRLGDSRARKKTVA
jgi:hypothetical protein